MAAILPKGRWVSKSVWLVIQASLTFVHINTTDNKVVLVYKMTHTEEQTMSQKQRFT